MFELRSVVGPKSHDYCTTGIYSLTGQELLNIYIITLEVLAYYNREG
jgi:hypothetical protein